MTLPGSFNKVTVTGTYTTLTGELAKGKVTFTPDSKTWLTAVPEKVVIVPRTITADLTNGTFAVDLPATDDPDILPNGGTYVVTEVVGTDSRTYSIQVPVGSGPIDLATVAPVQPVTATSRLVTSVNGTKPNGAGNIVLTPASIGALSAAAATPTEVGVFVGGVGDGAADDTTPLQAALTAGAGGVVRGRPGKTYLISAPLVISSGTTLDMTGCTIRLKSGSNCNMLRNAAVNTVRRVLDAAMTSGSVTLTSATAVFTAADVGKPVTVQSAGAAGAPLTTTISAVTNATTATLAATAAATVIAQYAAIGSRDSKIEVRGGYWFRETNNWGDGGAAQAHSLRFRHVDGLRVRDVTYGSDSGKYAINPGDCTDIFVRDIQFTTTTSDGVHLNGPIRRAHIRDVIAYNMGDDLVSLTCTDIASPVLNDTEGDIVDVVVDGSTATLASNFMSALKICGGSNSDQTRAYAVRNVKARNLTSPTVTASVVAITHIANTASVFDNITIDGVTSLGGNTASNGGVLLDGSGTWDRVLIRDVRTHPADAAAVWVTSKCQNVARLACRDLQHDATTTGRAPVMIAGNVNRLTIDGVTALPTAGFTQSVVSILGGQTPAAGVQRLTLANVQFECNYSASASLVLVGDANVALPQVHLSDITTKGINYPLGKFFGTTRLDAKGVYAKNPMIGWVHAAGSVAVVTVTGAAGLDADVETVTVDAGSTVRARSLGFRAAVDRLTKTAGDMAYNTNGALSCGTGPVVCDGTTWKHLHSGLTY